VADLVLAPSPPRSQLLQQLRPRLSSLVPGGQLLAVELLGEGSTIDFVALEPGGRVVLVFVGQAGQDLELVGRALAQRAWVEARLRDWLQLAPHLGVRPEAGSRALLVCPGFQDETRAAAEALGRDALALAQYRCVRNGAGVEALVEFVSGAAPASPDREPSAPVPTEPFRTGLSEADLGLTAAEKHEFE